MRGRPPTQVRRERRNAPREAEGSPGRPPRTSLAVFSDSAFQTLPPLAWAWAWGLRWHRLEVLCLLVPVTEKHSPPPQGGVQGAGV